MSACELQLIAEAKVRSLLGNTVERRFEASGVCVRGKECCVVRGAISSFPFLLG